MVLITVLIIVLLLFALVGAFLFLATNARRINARYNENLVALGLAEAGVDYAIWEINFGDGDFSAQEGWSGVNPKTTTINNFQDADGNIYGDINIWVSNPGTDEVAILSEGSFSSITGPTVKRQIRVKLERHKLFQYAILTGETIDIGGAANKIDSYDSSKGSYGEPYDGSINIGQNGDIVTNEQGDPSITLRGGAAVEGDATTGPSGTVSITGSATLSGETDDTAEVFIPPVTVPDSLKNLISEGDLSLDGQNSLEFFSGDYKYDSLNLSAKATLTLNGDVNLYFTQNPSINTNAQSQIIIKNGKTNIYFDGDINIAGQGASNEGGDPSDLTFYGTDTVSTINLAGIGEFFGTFYAPEADYFYISGNSEIYGAVVGKNVSLTGSAIIHYDENLITDGPAIGYDPYVWQEK